MGPTAPLSSEQTLKGTPKTASFGESTLSVAKKAVDSTIRRILVYTAEIIASIFLLIIICLPLAFTVPMWIQRVALGTAVADLWVNPLVWFGSFGAVAVTIGLAIASLVLGYPYVMKLIPGQPKKEETVSETDEEEESDYEEDTEPEEETEEVEVAEEDETSEDEINESESEEEVDDSDE